MMSNPTSQSTTTAASTSIWTISIGETSVPFTASHAPTGASARASPEKDVRVIGEPLGQRIEADDDERHGREVEAERIEQEAGRDQARRRQGAERHGAEQADLAGGQVAAGGARVQRVEFAVHDAVEGHGAGAGADHRGEDQAEGAPAGPAVVVARGDGHGGERERAARRRCGRT